MLIKEYTNRRRAKDAAQSLERLGYYVEVWVVNSRVFISVASDTTTRGVLGLGVDVASIPGFVVFDAVTEVYRGSAVKRFRG